MPDPTASDSGVPSADFSPAEERKFCVACGLPIRRTAKLCHHCSSHQRPWKNWLAFLAGVVALLTFFGSGVVFIWKTGSEIVANRRVESPLTILSLDKGELVVANVGNREVFVTSFAVQTEHGVTVTAFLNEAVPPKQIRKLRFRDERGGAIVRSDEAPELQQRLSRGEAGIDLPVGFYTRHDSDADEFLESDPPVFTFNGTGTLRYRILGEDSAQAAEAELVGVLFAAD